MARADFRVTISIEMEPLVLLQDVASAHAAECHARAAADDSGLREHWSNAAEAWGRVEAATQESIERLEHADEIAERLRINAELWDAASQVAAEEALAEARRQLRGVRDALGGLSDADDVVAAAKAQRTAANLAASERGRAMVLNEALLRERAEHAEALAAAKRQEWPHPGGASTMCPRCPGWAMAWESDADGDMVATCPHCSLSVREGEPMPPASVRAAKDKETP